MAKAEQAKAQEIAATSNQLPAHLQGHTKQHRVGNIDRSDLIIPRVKLLQGISEELTTFDAAKSGEFWHSIAAESLGTEIKAVPILLRKTYVLWSPRNDDRGILARAVDGLHWDLPGAEFTVKPKGHPADIKYKLGNTVHDKGPDGEPALSEFGSGIPGDPNSKPAAALTYEFLWWFPEFKNFSPSMIINTRSSVKPARMLINQIDMRPVEHYAQQYIIGRVQEKGDEGPYWNYKYTPAGYAAEEDYGSAMALFNTYSGVDFKASDERDDSGAEGGGGGGRTRGAGLADDPNSKF